jgi:hypothetical protein
MAMRRFRRMGSVYEYRGKRWLLEICTNPALALHRESWGLRCTNVMLSWSLRLGLFFISRKPKNRLPIRGAAGFLGDFLASVGR